MSIKIIFSHTIIIIMKQLIIANNNRFTPELAFMPLKESLDKHGVQYTFKNITKGLEEGLYVNGDLISHDRNLAGKSDYLRMEILYLEGGIYQDTDAHPIQPFDNFGDIFRWPFASYQTSYKVIDV